MWLLLDLNYCSQPFHPSHYVTCRAALWRFAGLLCLVAFLVQCCLLIIADQLLSQLCEQIFVDSCPFPSLPLGYWLLGKYGSGKLFPLIIQCRLAAACRGGSRFQGCHGYLSFCSWLLLPANVLGTSSQAHLQGSQ